MLGSLAACGCSRGAKGQAAVSSVLARREGDAMFAIFTVDPPAPPGPGAC